MKEPVMGGLVDEYFKADPDMFRAVLVLNKGGSMKKTYITVHVYDDGDNELTKSELTDQGVDEKVYDGDLCFDVATQIPKLTDELIEYGNEEKDVQEALAYILNAQPGESCIVGKV
jgi:hypothetical protein